MVVSLCQDPLVFNTLAHSEFGKNSLELIPAVPELWSPASLSIHALGGPVEVETLRHQPLKPIPSSLRVKVAEAYEDWYRTKRPVDTLEEAGLIALSMRERLRIKNSWQGFAEEIRDHLDHANTIIACLYGMVPDPDLLIEEFVLHDKYYLFSDLVIHAILTNPLPQEQQLEILKSIFSGRELPIILVTLEKLELSRPILAKKFAKAILDQIQLDYYLQDSQSEKKDEISFNQHDPFEIAIARLTKLLRYISLQDYSDNHDEITEPLTMSIELANHLQAQMQANLAHNYLKQNGNKTIDDQLRIWKKATQIAPDEPRYMNGLAKTLMASGRIDDARAYLEARSVEPGVPQHPLLLLTTAEVAFQQKDIEGAERAIKLTIGYLDDDDGYFGDDYLHCAELLSKLGQDLKAEEVLRKGFSKFPNYPELLTTLAEKQLNVGKLDEALEKSYLAFAMQGLSSPGSIYKTNGRDARELLIESLEKNNHWKSALRECVESVEVKEYLSSRDYHNLAKCALKAEEPQISIKASNDALNLDSKDGIACTYLGKALIETGEFSSALENLQRATRLSPDSVETWINLAEAYRKNSEEGLFVDTLNAAVHAVPEAPEIHYTLGTAYISQNSLTKALDSFRKAIQLIRPEHPYHFGNKDNQYFIDEKYFIMNPEFAMRVSLNTGKVLKQLGYIDDARSVLGNAYTVGKKLFDIDDEKKDVQVQDLNFVEIADGYGQLLMDIDNYQEAVDIYEFIVGQNNPTISNKLCLAKSYLLSKPSNESAAKAIEILLQSFSINSLDHISDVDLSSEICEQDKAEAQALFAESLAISGEFEKARDVFRKALETTFAENPDWKARMSFGLGRVALILNEPEMAVAALQEAAKLQKNNPDIYKLLSEAFFKSNLLDDSFTTSKKFLDASTRSNEDIQWYANYSGNIIEYAGIENRRLLQDAAAVLEEIISQNPEQQYLLIYLVKLHLKTGDREKAVILLREMIKQNVAVEGTYFREVLNIVEQLKIVDEIDLARDFLQYLINQYLTKELENEYDRKNISELLIVLSDLYYSSGDHVTALRMLDQTINLDPDNPEPYHLKAVRLVETGDLEEAEILLRDAIELHPEDISLIQDAAEFYYLKGELYKALSYYDALIEILVSTQKSQNVNRFYLNTAEVAYSALLSEKAFQYLKIIDLDQDEDEIHFHTNYLLAEILLEKGKDEDARLHLDKAKTLHPEHPWLIPLQSRIEARNNSLSEGLEFLEVNHKNSSLSELFDQHLSENYPFIFNHSGYRSLGEAYLELGEWNKAVEIFSKLVEAHPNGPKSHLDLVRAVVKRAEAQRLSQKLDVIKHAPGEMSLDHTASQLFQKSIEMVTQVINPIHPGDDTDLDLRGTDLLEQVEKWRRRGNAVFNLSLENVNAYKSCLDSTGIKKSDLQAYLIDLSGLEIELDKVRRITTDISVNLEKGEYDSKHHLQAYLALIVSSLDSLKALDYALQSEETIENEFDLLPLRFPVLDYLISRLAYQNKEYALALDSIQSALEEWPEEPWWNSLASDIFRSDDQINGLPNLSQASQFLENAINLQPEEISFYKRLGEILIQNGQPETAVNRLETAVELNPTDGDTWLSLAEAQMYADLIDQAAVSTAKAIEFSDDPVKPMLLRGQIDLQNNNPKGAYVIAEELLEKLPDLVDAILMLSKALVLLDQSEEALALLKNSISKVDEPLKLQIEYIKRLAESKGINYAISEINKIQKENADSPKVMAVLATIQDDAGQFNQAVETAIRALKIDDEELSKEEKSDLHCIVGRYYRIEGQLDQAIHHLVFSERVNPQNVEAILELGTVYHKRRQHEEALHYFQRAIELSPDNPFPYYLAGKLLKDMKDYAGAESALKKASHLDPNDMEIQGLLRAVSALNLIHNQRLVMNEMTTPT